MVWGLIHGSWRYRIAVLVVELRMLVVISKELWQFNWRMLKRFMERVSLDEDEEEDAGGGEGGLGMTICGLLWL